MKRICRQNHRAGADQVTAQCPVAVGSGFLQAQILMALAVFIDGPRRSELSDAPSGPAQGADADGP